MVMSALPPFLAVSASYLVAFLLTDKLIMPVQRYFLPDVSAWASLMFLPHGVRVLTAWLYGWWSILLLAPASFLTMVLLYGLENLTVWHMLSTMPGVLSAAFAFALAARFGRDLRFGAGHPARWREVLAVGILASILNAAGTMLALGEQPLVTLVCLLGDIIGLITCMLILAQVFRFARLWRGVYRW
jgi:hypothetical protein